MISKISDINDEEESFCSNPSSSSFTSTILSGICTRLTAATAAAAAYTLPILINYSQCPERGYVGEKV